MQIRMPLVYATVYPSGSVQLDLFWGSDNRNRHEELNLPGWETAMPAIAMLVALGFDVAVTCYGSPSTLPTDSF